ncbi:Arf-GAP with coiled-coil, ANK repeat and PH domain-containing protein 2 [Irineochytrium annulatum]|nr:Arf-GAP with coiled-coil, ANK repeat and PH domain-containing protein 2 [Irineochytrium annulatum]
MAFHNQCFELLSGLQHIMDALSIQLHEMRSEFQSSHKSEVAATDFAFETPLELYYPGSPRTNVRSSNALKAGYLFSKPAGNQRRTNVWRRQWYELSGSNLSYVSEAGVKVNVPLSISLVRSRRDDATRANVFEVINPSGTLTLQAVSDTDMDEWMKALQNAISKAIHTGSGVEVNELDDGGFVSTGKLDGSGEDDGIEDLPEFVRRLRSIPGNEACADCSRTKGVVWASCNLGILLCIGWLLHLVNVI